jgi:hypothetical protein
MEDIRGEDITRDDIQQDFSLLYDCGAGMPHFPLLKKFSSDPTADSIFDIFEVLKFSVNDEYNVAFLWNLQTNLIELYVDQEFDHPFVERKVAAFNLSYEGIKQFVQYQLKNSGIHETLLSMAPENQKKVFVSIRSSNPDFPLVFHSDKTIFTFLCLRNTQKDYVFGTELFMNSDKIEEEIKLSKRYGFLNGNCNVALQSLQEVLTGETVGTVYRNILKNEDTLLFSNYPWTHATPGNFSPEDDGEDEGVDSRVTILLGIGKGQMDNIPIRLCAKRKTMDKSDENDREAVILGIHPINYYNDFKKVEGMEFRLYGEETIPVLDIPEIVLSPADGSAQKFFKTLDALEAEKIDACYQFDHVALRWRGGKKRIKRRSRKLRKRKKTKTARNKKKLK